MINFVRKGDFKKDTFLIIHGLGEHIGRYGDFIDGLVEEGFSVIGFDLPGHGKSSGIRGHAPLRRVFRIVDSIVSDLENPPIVFGHSLGGLIGTRYVEKGGRAKGLILSSPGFSYDRAKVPGYLVALAKFLSPIVPFLPMNNRIDVERLSRNKDTVRRYREDPLVHDKISISLAKDFFVESVRAIEEAEKIGVPTLVLIGTADTITPPEGAERFFKNLRCEKRIVRFEGGYHELFEDPEHSGRFFKEIVSFAKGLEV